MNNGLKLEYDFVYSINNKKYRELNNNLKSFIKELYNDITEESILKCEKIKAKDKSDIKIIFEDKIKNISLKSGNSVSVHVESVLSFITFLNDISINKNIINYLLLYHYGDDTIDGSGNNRLSGDEVKLRYKREISIFNKYVNYKNILIKVINRVLFEGVNKNNIVDYIYYGNIEYGIWSSRFDLLNYFVNNKSMNLITPHFSSFTYQNWCRNVVYNKKMESHRYYVQIKWFSIVNDIEKSKV